MKLLNKIIIICTTVTAIFTLHSSDNNEQSCQPQLKRLEDIALSSTEKQAHTEELEHIKMLADAYREQADKIQSEKIIHKKQKETVKKNNALCDLADQARRAEYVEQLAEIHQHMLKELQDGANPNYEPTDLTQPVLHRLCNSSNTFKHVHSLLTFGANANKKDYNGQNTPLHIAVRAYQEAETNGEENIFATIQALLNHGARPHIRNNAYETAWDLALQKTLAEEHQTKTRKLFCEFLKHGFYPKDFSGHHPSQFHLRLSDEFKTIYQEFYTKYRANLNKHIEATLFFAPDVVTVIMQYIPTNLTQLSDAPLEPMVNSYFYRLPTAYAAATSRASATQSSSSSYSLSTQRSSMTEIDFATPQK